MKRFWTFLIFSSFVLTLLAQSNYRHTTANLYMRMEPNTTSKVITTIPKGTVVIIDEDCDCQWIPVSYNGHIGYISTKYLSQNKITRVTNVVNQPIKYYTNSSGMRVQSPTYYNSQPVGATALCRDGTYSFSQNRRGTCSHHGGVARWL